MALQIFGVLIDLDLLSEARSHIYEVRTIIVDEARLRHVRLPD